MVDYSKWDNIEVSDDEDETHPNIDNATLFRMRHDQRVERMKQMDLERSELQKTREDLKIREDELSTLKANGEDIALLQKTFDEDSTTFLEKEAAFKKKEKLCPLNVDTIGKVVFSKGSINSNRELPDEEKLKNFTYFVKTKEPQLRQFGKLRKFDDTRKFLQQNPDLVCKETGYYLYMWIKELLAENKMEMFERVSKQYAGIQCLLEIAGHMNRDPRACVYYFFTRLADGQVEVKKRFDEELERFMEQVKLNEKKRLEKMEKEKEERVGEAEKGEKEKEEVVEQGNRGGEKEAEEHLLPEYYQDTVGSSPEAISWLEENFLDSLMQPSDFPFLWDASEATQQADSEEDFWDCYE